MHPFGTPMRYTRRQAHERGCEATICFEVTLIAFALAIHRATYVTLNKRMRVKRSMGPANYSRHLRCNIWLGYSGKLKLGLVWVGREGCARELIELGACSLGKMEYNRKQAHDRLTHIN